MAQKIDFERHSIAELKQLILAAEKTIESKAKEELKKARSAAAKLAKDYGFTLDELVGNKSSFKASKPKTPPKYINPDDPSKTWSGRGRQPVWFKESLEKGKSRADMLL